jgi:hypothetical protein
MTQSQLPTYNAQIFANGKTVELPAMDIVDPSGPHMISSMATAVAVCARAFMTSRFHGGIGQKPASMSSRVPCSENANSKNGRTVVQIDASSLD